MGRVENIAIFEDTKRLYQTDPELAAAIRASSHMQEVILESDDVKSVPPLFAEPAEIIVSQKRSFEAARDYAIYPTCVMNFASATNPGGGCGLGLYCTGRVSVSLLNTVCESDEPKGLEAVL